MAPRRKVLVDVLAIIFGISSWVEISGLGVEMPLMIQILPEGWKLGSYVVVITQIANIGPLLYGAARKYKSHKVLEIPTIHGTLLVACLSCLLLSLFWDRTSIIAGQEHSTALLSLAFCLALVDCTSSVLYLPFMASFREIYVISCMIGEGACGLIPSLVGFVQGGGSSANCKNSTNLTNLDQEVQKHFDPEPRFSVSVYFVTLLVMVLISWIAFVLLNKLPSIQSEKVLTETAAILNTPATYNVATREIDDNVSDHENDLENVEHVKKWIGSQEFIILMTIQTYVCVMHNGILSSIQSFSCMPYGSLIYQLSVNLSLISNPIGCFVALMRPVWTLTGVMAFTLFNSAWAAYILGIALKSPTPPMMDNSFGPFMIVTSWVMYVGSVSYIKASIVAILRRKGGNTALFWGGAMSQVGSGFGGVFMFVIVNYTNLFVAGSNCVS